MKILAFLSLIFSLGYASIDERKIDFYFINDAWVSEREVENSLQRLEEIVLRTLPQKQTQHLNFEILHNWDQGTVTDFLEFFYQLQDSGQISKHIDLFGFLEIVGNSLTLISNVVTWGKGKVLKILAGILEISGETLDQVVRDTEKHIVGWQNGNVEEMLGEAYQKSFKNSHRALLISHGQGTFFANDFYQNINTSEYKNYLKHLAIGPYTNNVEEDGLHITLKSDDGTNTLFSKLPYTVTNDDTNETIIVDDVNITIGKGHYFVHSYLRGENSRKKILSDIEWFLDSLENKPSQWYIHEEKDKGTCAYKVDLKHRFDSPLDLNTDQILKDVYPFNDTELVYSVDGEYVKASRDGEQIENLMGEIITNKCDISPIKDGCYELTGTDEKIQANHIGSRYKIVGENGKGTCYYKVNVQDLYTADIYSNVYPFATNVNTEHLYFYNVEGKKVLSNNCKGSSIKNANENPYDCQSLITISGGISSEENNSDNNNTNDTEILTRDYNITLGGQEKYNSICTLDEKKKITPLLAVPNSEGNDLTKIQAILEKIPNGVTIEPTECERLSQNYRIYYFYHKSGYTYDLSEALLGGEFKEILDETAELNEDGEYCYSYKTNYNILSYRYRTNAYVGHSWYYVDYTYEQKCNHYDFRKFRKTYKHFSKNGGTGD
ncbi:MAG: Unknown protein [uncultured Campylobacterales bacterium]|uniref:Uncharacterized protein n=1 Tax=uncultured Campylobacterales bacterium TaxID=352960 RepID=A0A6S6SLN1_9BACT|nr:MAG: Unknown protein [uncultured Campylobacterales bacterium]